MTDALISGPIGVILGFFLSYWQSWRSARSAERAQLLVQMQQLVVAVTDLDRARREFKAVHVGARAKAHAVLAAGVEFYGVWASGGRNWEATPGALVPAARLIRDWDRAMMGGAREVTLAMARVAAAGLTLGMSENTAIARAAQRLTDAAIEDERLEAINEAVRQLRIAFYPNEA